MPKRIQRKRVKGWRMPPNTVYVGRPTKWGNPFEAGIDGTRDECVDLYRRGIIAARAAWFGGPESIFSPENKLLYEAWESAAPHLQATFIEGSLDELVGKNLACWCPLDQPCHADVLLELANSEEPETCAHDFKGWREIDGGRGGERFCTKCGLGAMAHSMRYLP